MSTENIIELAKKYKTARENRLSREKEIDALKSEENGFKAELLDAMVDEGIKSLTSDEVGTVSLKTSVYLSCTKANLPSLYDYIKEIGYGGLFRETIEAKTLDGFISEHLEQLIQARIQDGLDAVDARNAALEFFQTKGVSSFTDRNISLTKK